MAKDKKKKKKADNIEIDELVKEYNESLELLKAKHKQLDGILREVELYLGEVKQIKDDLQVIAKPLDEE